MHAQCATARYANPHRRAAFDTDTRHLNLLFLAIAERAVRQRAHGPKTRILLAIAKHRKPARTALHSLALSEAAVIISHTSTPTAFKAAKQMAIGAVSAISSFERPAGTRNILVDQPPGML